MTGWLAELEAIGGRRQPGLTRRAAARQVGELLADVLARGVREEMLARGTGDLVGAVAAVEAAVPADSWVRRCIPGQRESVLSICLTTLFGE